MILNTFESYFVLAILEFIKITLVILATYFLARARRARVLELDKNGQKLPWWLRDPKLVDQVDVAFYVSHEKPTVYNPNAKRSLIASIIYTLLFIALQFGLCRNNYWSLWKCVAVVIFIIAIGGVLCRDSDRMAGWEFFGRIVVPSVAIGLSVATIMFAWFNYGPSYTGSSHTSDAYASQWLMHGSGTIARDVVNLDPDATIIVTLDKTLGEYTLKLPKTTFEASDEGCDVKVQLVADAVGTPYVDRNEGHYYIYDYTCRLPIFWTLTSQRTVVYTYHYARGSLDFDVPFSIGTDWQ